jgi:AraC-like DNA-binding protein
MKASADFASAAMMRLIQLSMKQQGLSVEKTASVDKLPASARVALSSKQDLLAQLHRAFGATALLRMGEAVHIAPDEPALVALAMARDPLDLIARWQRLERFVHSRHRVHARAHKDIAGKHSIELQHRSLDPAHAPSAAEDLLVLGLLVALLNLTAAQQLQARFVGDLMPRWQHGKWHEAKLPTDTSRWLLTWRHAAALEAVERGNPINDASTAKTANKLLSADAGRAWTVAALAKEMTTSTRHLQRRLQAQQTSFSALLTGARLAQASKYLVGTQQGAAEIGYACGYADQAHFNREFKRHTAMTPSAYRLAFGKEGWRMT